MKPTLHDMARQLQAPAAWPQAVKASPVPIHGGMGAAEVLRAILANCLLQVVANATVVALGQGQEPHVHQLRVGLRRLRTAIRELEFLAPDAAWPAREAALAQTFQALGAVRDRHSVFEPLKRQLQAAGIADVAWIDARRAPGDPAQIVRERTFLAALAEVQAFALETGEPPAKRPPDLRHLLVAPLAQLHTQVAKDGRRFQALSAERQHRVRKRLKRLRYLSEFLAPLFKGDATHRYLASLSPAQDALGEHNDLAVASAAAQAAADQGHAGAAQALPWLAQALEASGARSAAAVGRLAGVPRFWLPARH